MGWYLEVLVKYADFGGRATRSEYWWFNFFNLIVIVALAVLAGAAIGPLVLLGYAIAIIVPSLAVSVRRLHDTNRNGWWLLLGLIPFGGLVLLIFYVTEGTPGPNNYGSELGMNEGGSSRRIATRNVQMEDELMRLYELHKTGAMSLEDIRCGNGRYSREPDRLLRVVDAGYPVDLAPSGTNRILRRFFAARAWSPFLLRA